MNRPDLNSPPTPVTELAAEALNNAATQGGDAVRQFVAKAGDLTQRGVQQWRGQAIMWRDGTAAHVRAHPLRSVAIATGAGMLLALLLRGLRR